MSKKISREEIIKCFNIFRVLRTDKITTPPANNKRQASSKKISIQQDHQTMQFHQNSGHGKRRDGGLNAGDMSFRYGGSQQKMRNAIINKLETYPPQLKQIGDIQSPTFTYGDAGLFYLFVEEREGLKSDVLSGKKRIMSKN